MQYFWDTLYILINGKKQYLSFVTVSKKLDSRMYIVEKSSGLFKILLTKLANIEHDYHIWVCLFDCDIVVNMLQYKRVPGVNAFTLQQ